MSESSGTTNPSQTAPRHDEVEISVFGPGVGECSVVHVGGGDWVVVDSCLAEPGGEPIALKYLKGLGVDVARSIKVIVVTHWHDDHIRGVSQLVEAAPAAVVCVSQALRKQEFFTLVECARDEPSPWSGAEEFLRLFNIWTARSVGPKFVSDGHLLYRRQSSNELPGCDLFALSPSQGTASRALRELVHVVAQEGVPKRRLLVGGTTPNEAAIVVSIESGAAVGLLGADLEKAGWSAVVRSDAKPATKASVFKVPHHGADSGDEPGVWPAMLGVNPVACVAPYTRSGLPTSADISRLRSRTPEVYCTTSSQGRKPKRDSAVEKMIRTVARDLRETTRKTGQIRSRVSIFGGLPTVTLFDGAFKAA